MVEVSDYAVEEGLGIDTIFLDYNLIGSRLDNLSRSVKESCYDSIVMIVRGGTFAGMHMVFMTELPYTFMTYDRESDRASFFGDVVASGRKVLLCEDFVGRGKTLIRCKETLEDMGYEVDTLVISTDSMSASEPMYRCFHLEDRTKRFIFPWERYRINGDVFEKGDGKSDIVFERCGYDSVFDEGDIRIDFSGVGVKDRDTMRDMIIENRLTEIVVSDSVRGIFLASYFPELRVYWYDGCESIRIMA